MKLTRRNVLLGSVALAVLPAAVVLESGRKFRLMFAADRPDFFEPSWSVDYYTLPRKEYLGTFTPLEAFEAINQHDPTTDYVDYFLVDENNVPIYYWEGDPDGAVGNVASAEATWIEQPHTDEDYYWAAWIPYEA